MYTTNTINVIFLNAIGCTEGIQVNELTWHRQGNIFCYSVDSRCLISIVYIFFLLLNNLLTTIQARSYNHYECHLISFNQSYIQKKKKMMSTHLFTGYDNVWGLPSDRFPLYTAVSKNCPALPLSCLSFSGPGTNCRWDHWSDSTILAPANAASNTVMRARLHPMTKQTPKHLIASSYVWIS